MSTNRPDVILSIFVMCVIVSIIACVFLLTGQVDLITKFFSNVSAEGNMWGITFTAGGPLAMFIIIYITIRNTRTRALGSIRINLLFQSHNIIPPPPLHPTDFENADCSYVVFSNDREIRNSPVQVRYQLGPYIYVNVPDVDNPEIQVRLTYNGRLWISDSYSPRIGSVPLQ